MNVRWLPVVGYEGLYEVSDQGDIRTVKTGRIRTLTPHPSGHLKVALSRDGRLRTFGVHRLVALAFIGESEDGRGNVLHGDGNPANNDYRNLRWGTHRDNALDSVRHGTNSNARKTHCPRGHEYDRHDGPEGRGRRCLQCKRDRRASRARGEQS